MCGLVSSSSAGRENGTLSQLYGRQIVVQLPQSYAVAHDDLLRRYVRREVALSSYERPTCQACPAPFARGCATT